MSTLEAPPRSAEEMFVPGASGESPTPQRSLKQLALLAGVRDYIEEDKIEVFAHGTTAKEARNFVESEGGNLSSQGGNYGGQLYTSTDLKVVQDYAAASLTGPRPEEPGAVGIAVPASVMKRLKQQKLVTTRPFGDRAGFETVFEPGAIEILKSEGYFFDLTPTIPHKEQTRVPNDLH
jgi:hypothetical protein